MMMSLFRQARTGTMIIIDGWKSWKRALLKRMTESFGPMDSLMSMNVLRSIAWQCGRPENLPQRVISLVSIYVYVRMHVCQWSDCFSINFLHVMQSSHPPIYFMLMKPGRARGCAAELVSFLKAVVFRNDRSRRQRLRNTNMFAAWTGRAWVSKKASVILCQQANSDAS